MFDNIDVASFTDVDDGVAAVQPIFYSDAEIIVHVLDKEDFSNGDGDDGEF